MSIKKKLKICLVAGEISGDQLAAGLMKSLINLYPNISFEFYGIGGELMQKQNLKLIEDIKKISFMGVTEVIKNLFGILAVRKKLKKVIYKDRPDIYIGIDAPDFNLPVEKYCKKIGIKTVIHYISPSIWAWRESRIKKMLLLDNILCILPFEPKIYQKHNIPATYVGHRLAHLLNTQYNQQELRKQYKISNDKKIVAILPGSRNSEIQHHLHIYLNALQKYIKNNNNNYLFLIPVAKEYLFEPINNIIQNFPSLEIKLINQQSHDVLHMSDFALVTSGTATLDAMLCHCPMVIAYKTDKFTYFLIKKLVKTKYAGLVNIIFDTMVAPELIQNNLNVNNICENLSYVEKNSLVIRKLFQEKHNEISLDSDTVAAKTVIETHYK